MNHPTTRIGIVGGTGLYQMNGLTSVQEVNIDTPFGTPSDAITVGLIDDVPVAFLPRHGRNHRLLPSEIPYQANVFALKMLGVERLISVSAVGSLRENIAPLDLVIPDQLIDRTRTRAATFFGDGIAVHASMADPYCPDLCSALASAVRSSGPTVHEGGTYVVIEGPAFSTRAESDIYRGWGANIIGMTALPEAKLAREAEMCYSTLACVTDYDVWREEGDGVTTEMIVANLDANAESSQRTLVALVPHIARQRVCGCGKALASAIATNRSLVATDVRERLAPLLGKYLV